jgi:3'(2'), 5'-bisphosphate nucleotidase
MSLTLTTEQQVAVAAVKRACSLTSSVFNKLVKNETLVKGDKSPVTGSFTPSVADPDTPMILDAVGDFAAQAVVNTILSLAFPMDAIVGEEDARDLRSPESAELRNRVLDLSRDALAGPLGIGEQEQWGLGPGKTWSDEELLGALDRGNGNGGRSGRELFPAASERSLWLNVNTGFWCLDPIDGTKGFLRGEQYAVCLALVVDSQVQLGVIGCPNLPQDLSELDSPRGSLFVAVRGKGAQQVSFYPFAVVNTSSQSILYLDDDYGWQPSASRHPILLA